MRYLKILMIIGICHLLLGCASIKESYVDSKTFKIKTRLNFHKKQDEKRRDLLEKCKITWVYSNLNTQTELRIIQYRKAFRFDLVSQPAMIIGTTSINDTVRIFIYNYQENLSKGDQIKVYPDTTLNLKDNMTLLLIKRDLPVILSKKKSEDKYYCDIKKTYFGKIKK
jgi:hypothetical protein